MHVLARFTLESTLRHLHQHFRGLQFRQQYDPSLPADGAYSDSVPGGQLTLNVSEPAPAAALEIGETFYVAFIPAKHLRGEEVAARLTEAFPEAPAASLLHRACVPGQRVTWKTLAGHRYEGTLAEWDSNVAVVRLDDGTTKAVEC